MEGHNTIVKFSRIRRLVKPRTGTDYNREKRVRDNACKLVRDFGRMYEEEMERVLDIGDYMNRLTRDNVTPEDLFGRAIRNLHSLESIFIAERRTIRRNDIRAVIADGLGPDVPDTPN